jgi:ABC-2 type transport system permease protein
VSAFRTIWLVARRELRERIASRAFQVSTAFTVLLVLGLLLAPTIFGLDDPASYTVGTFGETPPGIDAAIVTGAPDDETTVTLQPFDSEAALRTAVENGDVDIGVVDGDTLLEGPATSTQLRSLTLAAVATAGIETRAADLGLDAADLAALAGEAIEVEDLGADQDDGDEESQAIVAFVGTVLLFISIVTYGQWILIGVVEEKSSRVVEVVLGAVRPRHLLAGKVLGIGVLGLAQLVVIGGLGLIILRTTETFDVPDIGPSILAIVIGWFLLGFTFYATGFAVAGSLVSRQEEAQNASFPLTIVLLIGYFVSTSALEGDNPVVRVFSIVPPFSPMAMPLRQAVGDALAWEVLVSVALMIAAIVIMLRIGGRTYAGGLLKSGGKVSLRDAFRSAEA